MPCRLLPRRLRRRARSRRRRGEETPKTTASWIASSVDTRLRRQLARGTPGQGLSQPQREESGGRARRHCPSGSSRPGVGTARTAVRIDGDGRCSRATDRVATATSPRSRRRAPWSGHSPSPDQRSVNALAAWPRQRRAGLRAPVRKAVRSKSRWRRRKARSVWWQRRRICGTDICCMLAWRAVGERSR